MKNGFVVAIDGPAGAGKSTVAKLVAEKLGFAYLDTGAMYRAVTWKFLQSGQVFSPELVGKLAASIQLSFRPEAGSNKVFVEGTEVTQAIRSTEVTALVSKVAAVGAVRTAMVEEQRRLGSSSDVVLDGRDIGTVVFPQAQCKIFLTASVATRAQRRYLELKAKGQAADLTQIEADIALRDKKDSERTIAPLKCAQDAVFLDTSTMGIEEVVQTILHLVRERQ